ncbi:hypothetical protein LWI29_034366 [Acer saccharum]|uniref:C2H2-type domain-containing protein n=1 Tax=Acer saccharum TaxID=4024 RepID=A0AA39VKH0_ACESA|nr:hypothetical protein LWI29_034366 [Acer saccharum]
MEKHRCKLCFKNFSNGRALGGHMRSHMLNLPIPPRHEEEEEERPTEPNQLSDGDTESGSLSSSSSDEEGEGGGGEKGNLCYGLRENPKRSFRLVDPEFSFAAAAAAAAAVDAGSVVLQDRESETESSKNPTRRRSKRTRKLDHHHHQFDHHHQFHHHHQYHHQQQQQENGTKKLKFHKLSKTTESSSWAHEPEPVSSISDTTTEEDVAFCLMMLSRDKWKRKEQQLQQKQQQRRRQVFVVDQEEEEEEAEAEAEKSMEETDESDEFIKSCKNRSRVGKYKCDTCKKVFKSYQALGGHRASHKKIKFYNTTTATQTTKQTESEQQENAGTSIATPMLEKTNKVHECPVCFRVFSSGQALGGHKRTHVTGLVAATTTSTTPARTQHHQRHVTSSSTKFGDNLIDLNLPAPVDDDDISQIELSAVSDAEFVNHIKR